MSGPVAFKQDYRKALATPRHRDIAAALAAVTWQLASEVFLAVKYRDHALSGEYTHHRECHLKPDLLLLYKKPDSNTLRLVRLGSHSELF